MKAFLLGTENNQLVAAKIILTQPQDRKLVSEQWTFNWRRCISLPHSKAFKIITTANPERIEGLMLFQIKDIGGQEMAYMAFLEVAPHNRGIDKELDFVAGCLIARACMLSFTEGKGPYKGFLAFKCMKAALIPVYQNKYKAVRVTEELMYIEPFPGKDLINTYLLRNVYP